MKKILILLCLLVAVCRAKAGEPTSDRVYATDVRIDSYDNSLYVNVCLYGSRKYIAYGTDVLLPSGLVAVSKSNGTPNVVMIDDEYQIDEEIIYPYEEGRRGNTYYHTVSSAFPDGDKHHVRVGCLFSQEEYFTAESGALFRIYVEREYVEGTWPLGAIKVYNAELNVIGQPYDAPDTETIVPLHTGETTLTLNVSDAAKWSTCILPFSASIPEGVKAYTCSSNDENYIYLTEAESFAAYTPYILYAENGYSGTVSGTVEAAVPDVAKSGVVVSGYLTGAIVPQTATEGYVLQKQDEGVKFYAIGENDSFTIPAGKCWMQVPEGGSARSYTFKIQETTSVTKYPTQQEASTLAFDLLGRQIPHNKGIIIRDRNKTLNP